MANPSVTTANSTTQAKQHNYDASKAVIDVKAKEVKDKSNKPADSTRVQGQSLASVKENLQSAKWKMASSDDLNQSDLPNQLAIAPVVDVNGQIVNLENSSEEGDAVIKDINEAEAELLAPDDGNIELDKEATGFWSGAVQGVSNAGKSLFSMVGGLFGDAIPAAKQLFEQTPTKKSNKLATHAGMLGAGLVGVSSISHLIKAGESFFGRKDNQVPGVYYLLESLAQGGFTANVFKSAMEGKLNIKNTLYQAAGLLGLKVGENVLDGTAPKALDFVGGDVLKAGGKIVKDLGSPDQGAVPRGQGAPQLAG